MLYRTYQVAQSLEDAVEVLARRDPGSIRIIAGGTDLMVELARQKKAVDVLLDVASIVELKQIRLEAGKLLIGAAATYTDIITSPLIQQHAPLLVDASGKVGAFQIQNMGTIGGNLANGSPAGDAISCLYALNASVVLRSTDGDRETPVDQFFQGYRQTDIRKNELIKGVSFEPLREGEGGAFVKFGLRKAQAISVVMAAAVLHIHGGLIHDASVALGAVAPTVVRSYSAEQVLYGEQPSLELFARAAEAARNDISPIDDIRGSAVFRGQLVGPLVQRVLESATKRANTFRIEADR